MMCDVFFFKQKTAYEMRISVWSSEVCSSDLVATYWEKQDVEAFGVHIFEKELSVDQRLDGTPINPRRSQKNWGCICNVASVGGIELEGRVEIRALSRSEERRVGKECVSTCSYGGSP